MLPTLYRPLWQQSKRPCRATCGWWLVVLLLLAGCRTRSLPPPPTGETTLELPTTAPQTNALARSAPLLTAPYAWDQLAHLAATRSNEAEALLYLAQAERHKAAVDAGWRNPQLRFGYGWGDLDETTPARGGTHYLPGTEATPFVRQKRWEDRDFDGGDIRLRLYVSNPFVNRWIRRRGTAAAHALENQAQEEAYIIYCETRSLCLEVDFLNSECQLLTEMLTVREKIRELRRNQLEAGAITPLKLMQAETRVATLRSDLKKRQLLHNQLVRRLAILAGVPVENFALQARPPLETLTTAQLNPIILTDLAFMRRPDLTRLELEKEVAHFDLQAARAKQIPWFEYIDGVYAQDESKTRSYEEYTSGYHRTSRDATEWQLRLAFGVPIFNWLGDEIKRRRAQLAAAQARLSGQYDLIRLEIEGALADYQHALSEWQTTHAEAEALHQTIRAQLDELLPLEAVKPEEVLELREGLLAYARVNLQAEKECLLLKQLLEDSSGGDLPEP